MPVYLLLLGLILPSVAWSYPQFIGYKYSSCLTCHYNGQGNGPLNDYGRALWSAEIAGRALALGRTDEQLGESSGFLGSKPLPWWFRPGLKSRYLAQTSEPPKGETRFIVMQAEANAAFFLDQDQKYTFVGSFGYVPVPRARVGTPGEGDIDEWISREHYFRWMANEQLWIYAGMLDKVYGIRHANHTAFSRTRTGVSMNDQTHGIVGQYIQPNYEVTLHGFMGNMYQDSELRQQGMSGLFEYEIMEAFRLGATFLSSTNKFVKNQRLGFVSRKGFGHGSALLFEAGLIEDTPKAASKKLGYYIYAEAIQRLARGYHLFVVGQSYKDKLETGHADQMKTGFGFLMFPMARTELRVELENGRQLNDTPEVRQETWSLLSQLHLSF